MKSAIHVAITTVFWVVLAVTCFAQSDEKPDIEFHAPFRTSVADSPQEFQDKYLLGDWMGLRSKLAHRGVRFALLSITDPFGNATGGQRRGASDYNLVAVGVLLDTGYIAGWHGGTFHVGFADNFGTRLSEKYVGNGFPVQLADVADAHPRLTYLSYTQEMFEEKVSIRVGRLTINSVSHEEFLGSEYFKAFTSVGIDLVPLGLFFNAPGAFGYPDTTWGTRIKFQPSSRFYTMAGAYNGDPNLKNGTHHGLDFSIRGPLFLIGEAGWRRNYPKDRSSFSADLKFGGYYNGGRSMTFGSGIGGRPSQTRRGRYGLYVLGDQVLSRWGDPGQNRHLGVFGAFTFAPDQRVNKMPYFFDTGLVAYGPLRSRPRDFAGFAVVYGSYSRDLRRMEEIQSSSSAGVQKFEMALEWNYGLAIRPGLLLQPDIQWLVRPNGIQTIPNALAVGANIVVNW